MIQIQQLKNCLAALLIIFAVFFTTAPVFAAEISLDSQNREIGIGSQFEVTVSLNTENEDINALEGKLFFSGNLLALKEIKDGGSIINFWMEEPKQTEKEIVFSGIVPGGYIGGSGRIFSAVFYAKKEGKGFIEIRNPKVLLNDGQGTETKTKTSILKIAISAKTPSVLPPEKKDIEPPEDFLPEITRDPSVFGNKWFLVFSTQDKESGINYYKVCEGKRKCVTAESPYLLKNQNLDEEIIVKAVDKSGNNKIVVLPPQKPKIWYENYLYLVILIAGVMPVYIIRKLWKKYFGKN